MGVRLGVSTTVLRVGRMVTVRVVRVVRVRHGLHPTGLAIDPDVVGPTRLVLEGAVEVATSHDVRDTLCVFRARDLLAAARSVAKLRALQPTQVLFSHDYLLTIRPART